MAKSKDSKTASKVKSEAPITKTKKAVPEVAPKPSKKDKKSKKAPSPEPSSSEEESDDSADDSEDESEVETKKPAATNGHANGKANGSAAKKEVSSSESSESSDSESDESDSDDSKPAANDDDSDDSESEDSESDDDAAPVAAALKNGAKSAVIAGKAAVNGAAKAVAKATTDSDDDEEDDDDADSDEEEDSDDSDDSDASEEDTTSKKRKADDTPVTPAKKAKVESVDDNGVKNLFVGNLSWNIDEEWLTREFEEFGELTGVRVITDRETGRAKGFGYVEFANAADAAAALKAKNGQEIDGRKANIDFSTPRDKAAPRERADQRAKSFGDSQNPPSDTLFVGNVSFEANEDMLGEAFGAHGTVVNVRLPTDMDSGNPKGFGYITFSSVEDAKNAYDNMTGAEIGGRPVRLDYATPRPERSEGGGRGGGRGGRGGFGDRGGRGGGRGGRGGFGDRGGRGGARGGRGGTTNRGGFGDFKGKKQTFA